MSELDIGNVMADLATAAQTVLDSGRVAYGFPNEGLRQGDVIVGYPEDPIELGVTFHRGIDRAAFPLFRICGLPQDESTRTEVAAAISGASDLVAAIEGYAGSWSSVSVQTAQVERWDPLGGSSMVVVRFRCDVLG